MGVDHRSLVNKVEAAQQQGEGLLVALTSVIWDKFVQLPTKGIIDATQGRPVRHFEDFKTELLELQERYRHEVKEDNEVTELFSTWIVSTSGSPTLGPVCQVKAALSSIQEFQGGGKADILDNEACQVIEELYTSGVQQEAKLSDLSALLHVDVKMYKKIGEGRSEEVADILYKDDEEKNKTVTANRVLQEALRGFLTIQPTELSAWNRERERQASLCGAMFKVIPRCRPYIKHIIQILADKHDYQTVVPLCSALPAEHHDVEIRRFMIDKHQGPGIRYYPREIVVRERNLKSLVANISMALSGEDPAVDNPTSTWFRSQLWTLPSGLWKHATACVWPKFSD